MLVLTYPNPASAGPAYLAADDFSGTLANWTNDGAWSISDGALHCSGGGGPHLLVWAGAFSATDYAVECDIYISGEDIFTNLMARYSADDWYMLRLHPSNSTVLMHQYSTLAYSASPAAGWATYRLEVQGTALRAYRNGALVVSATDGTLSSGVPGIHAWNGATNARWDNFKVLAL